MEFYQRIMTNNLDDDKMHIFCYYFDAVLNYILV